MVLDLDGGRRVKRVKHYGHLRGGSRALGRVQSGADGAGRDRHEGGGLSEMDTVGKRLR